MRTWWLAAAVLCLSGAARAEVFGESPRTMMFEVKLGPYTPLIDRSFTSSPGPYQTVFGGGPMLLGEVELEYEFFQKLGSASAGVGVGYAEKYGKALDAAGQPTSQTTGLQLAPLKALLSYRFDWLSLKHDVPLVPYAKLAFVAMPWWMTNGGTVEVADGLRGAGVKYGFAGTLGLGLTLDFLDHRLARDFDVDMGINHTYLFGEFTLQEMTNFGTMPAGNLDLSSRHWLFGLAFEF